MNNPISDTARTARRCANVRMVSFQLSPSCERKYTISRKFRTERFSRMANFRHIFAPKQKKKYSRKIKSTKVYRYTFRGGPGNCRTLGKWTNINIRKGKPPHVEKLTPFYLFFVAG